MDVVDVMDVMDVMDVVGAWRVSGGRWQVAGGRWQVKGGLRSHDRGCLKTCCARAIRMR